MAVLELTNISKHFGAIHAVNDVSFSIEPGEVVGLMGDNGAGKSTLVTMIAGNYRPTEGAMKMDGAELVLHKPVDARRHGIEIVHQDLALCNNLTAAANVFLGRELRRGVGPFRVLDYASMYRRAGEIFKELKSETRPRDLVKQMSGGQRQAVALVRAVLSNPTVMLLDEPTSAMDNATEATAMSALSRLCAGKTMVYVTHKLQLLDYVTRVVVLDAGVRVADGPKEAVLQALKEGKIQGVRRG